MTPSALPSAETPLVSPKSHSAVTYLEASRRHWLLVLGLLSVSIPTAIRLGRDVWSTEQGAHGPIVLASGVWLLARMWPEIRAKASRGNMNVALIGLSCSALLYIFGRMLGVIGIETFALASILLMLLYASVGARALKFAWFPILYLGFLIPLPDTLVALITGPLKLAISEAAAALLQTLDYPVASTGVTLQIAQYELLVAAACSGLNAVISLTAIGLFYVYLLHHSSWRYAALLLLFVIPAAVFANFIRVVALILVTYHFGDAAAQGFLHGAAGMATFVAALLFIFGIDALLTPLRHRLLK